MSPQVGPEKSIPFPGRRRPQQTGNGPNTIAIKATFLPPCEIKFSWPGFSLEDPLKKASARDGGDPIALANELARFFASAEILKQQAATLVGQGQLALLKAAEEEVGRANDIRGQLERIRDESRADFIAARNEAKITFALGTDEQAARVRQTLRGTAQSISNFSGGWPAFIKRSPRGNRFSKNRRAPKRAYRADRT